MYFACNKQFFTIETNPGARINVNRHIRVRPIRQAWSIPEGFPKIFYLLWAPFKAMFLSVQLFWIMGCISQKPDFIIVQVRKILKILFRYILIYSI